MKWIVVLGPKGSKRARARQQLTIESEIEDGHKFATFIRTFIAARRTPGTSLLHVVAVFPDEGH